MHRSYRFAAAAALIGLVGLSATATAQNTANASATATAFVAGIAPLTANTVNDLDFGTVSAGSSQSPGNLAANAARFSITGQPTTPVTVSFALPTALTGSGSATIPISFSGTDGLQWTSYPSTFFTFNPNSSYLTAIDPLGNLVIGLSGTVSPPLGTTTGSYTGTITLTVAY